mmetsp:Transcript_28457/g.67123  ORF Transcript_28457/g.67123 Transcript_28457/m.67123 type:complete len:257 (+) Transcript_28457:272-1042(+)
MASACHSSISEQLCEPRSPSTSARPLPPSGTAYSSKASRTTVKGTEAEPSSCPCCGPRLTSKPPRSLPSSVESRKRGSPGCATPAVARRAAGTRKASREKRCAISPGAQTHTHPRLGSDAGAGAGAGAEEEEEGASSKTRAAGTTSSGGTLRERNAGGELSAPREQYALTAASSSALSAPDAGGASAGSSAPPRERNAGGGSSPSAEELGAGGAEAAVTWVRSAPLPSLGADARSIGSSMHVPCPEGPPRSRSRSG